MTTIITRSALIHWGRQNVPPDLAYIVDDPWHGGRRIVTWAEVLKARRERQQRALCRKRYVEPWRAVKLWVAYFDQDLMGGWQAFLDDWRGHSGGTWIDRDGEGYKGDLMDLFPLGVTDWERWKQKFARTFCRRTQDRQPVGVTYLWRCGWKLALQPERESR